MPRKDKVPHLRLRLDPDLLARLEKSRAKAGRTLTGEITLRLERSFRRDETLESNRRLDERLTQSDEAYRAMERALRSVEQILGPAQGSLPPRPKRDDK
jgi:hypothetical protein